MAAPTPPPWHLTGRAAAMLHSWSTVQLLVEYEESPVGPYLEYAIVVFTSKGPSVTLMEVTSETSRQAGRRIWGFPKTVSSLSSPRSPRAPQNFNFRRSGQSFHLRPLGPEIPVDLHAFTIQTRGHETVRVPCRVKAHARVAFRGRQLAIQLSNFELTVDVATPL